ncbi:MAG TPA: phosphoribosylformylglycinamidine synthase subunit PurL, partial [Thermoplasmatales archaeon]|nr:phosphoribosylformylglycinamidine synthase subunit PurL [Thermoplasmatales archaeon]HEX08767.1 phosphoribosylformylglycinamidine synthase subunit PurL [Thermoplasmatales archaeon]
MDIWRLFKKKKLPFEVYEVDLFSANDRELLEISKQMGLALSIDEMEMIRDYFKKKGRLPTDIELQALGQAWSEHCCYKSSKFPLKQYIYDVAKDRIVAREDAGVIEFDDDHYYVAALESHNHPSAIEPYGGAATGIGGIVRDVVCMGAQPLVFIDPLFFGPLDHPYNKLPKGVKHPRYLLRGVVSGIRDYGNRIGIPTACGQVYFHEKYVGNCLVNVGCIGIVRKDKLVHSRAKTPGNIYVYVGGKTGRDGIHGVTFASAELTEESEESSISAVQLGDPITKEPLIHATLECNEKGLLEGLKDFGGGGLSCVCGELAYEAGFGAEIHLDNVPLKEEGMAPWEIWVSESQERMMFLVTEENLDEVLHICKKWDVFATPIGKVIREPVIRAFYKGEKILEMDISFQVGGPVYDSCKRPYTLPKKKIIDEDFKMPDLNDILLDLLSSPNIACKDWVIRQYDHEVRGNTLIKPLQGKLGKETHGDATVIKPLEDSYKGLAITADINPGFMEIDPYLGACSAVDEVCRNLVAVGARPDSLTDCLNFGNPEKPERMGEFYEACKGLRDVAEELNLPFISGNVSFYNEAQGISIPPTPTLVGIGIVEDVRKCITSDIKEEGNILYIIGNETKKELGGSEYYKLIGKFSSIVPKVKVDLLKRSINCILELIDKNLLKSCHDISEGGIGVCISEMIIGGDIGARIDLSKISSDLRADFKLFSETNT